MPHHEERARRAERAAERANQLADQAQLRAQAASEAEAGERAALVDTHRDAASRMRAAASALRRSAQLERDHEDKHGDRPSIADETDAEG
jgi:hypothetical protein